MSQEVEILYRYFLDLDYFEKIKIMIIMEISTSVTFSSLFTGSSSLSVFARGVLYQNRKTAREK